MSTADLQSLFRGKTDQQDLVTCYLYVSKIRRITLVLCVV